MFRDYFRQIQLAYTRPGRFFEQALQRADLAQALRFSALTGVCVALELGISEAFASSSLAIVALVTVLTLLALPLCLVVWVFVWAAFIRLCGFLLQEDLPSFPLRLMVGYSAAGFFFLGLGGWVGKVLSLAAVFFQVLGLEKALKCSRWTAALFVFLPVSIFAVWVGFFSLMFKVF